MISSVFLHPSTDLAIFNYLHSNAIRLGGNNNCSHMMCINIHNTRTKVVSSWLAAATLSVAWEVSYEWYEALFCFIYTYKHIWNYSDLEYDPPHKPGCFDFSYRAPHPNIPKYCSRSLPLRELLWFFQIHRIFHIYIYIIEGIHSIHELLTTPLVGCTSKLFQSIFRSRWQVSSPYVFWNCYVSCWRHGPIQGIRFAFAEKSGGFWKWGFPKWMV